MRKHLAVLAAFVLALGGGAQLHADTFGPGPHWVDTVTRGTVNMDVQGQFTLEVPGMGIIALSMVGEMTVWHDDAVDTPDVMDPGHMNHVGAEIVAMNLTGTMPGVGGATLIVGDGVGNGLPDGPLATFGEVAETPGALLANSSFDMFFQVDVDTGGGTMRFFNHSALLAEGQIDRIPPWQAVYTMAAPTPVFAEAEPLEPVWRISSATFTLVPEPATLSLLAVGSLAMLRRRRKPA